MDEGWFVVGEERVPPLCGEFHFWRNNVLYWPRIFAQLKALGLRHVASYVHWEFHELAPGKFDFTGETNPQRDLEGFLNACAGQGVWLNLRPGPYIYAETDHLGVPERVFKYHRLHPEYLREARRYVEAVCEVVAPHQATRGGPVFLVQVDNESSAFAGPGQGAVVRQVLEGGPDDQGSWQNYLKRRFGDLSVVSERYGAPFDDWEDIEPVIVPRHAGELRCFLDACHFLEWYNAEYFRILSEAYREAGIEVPLYTNSTGPPFPHDPDLNAGNLDLLATDLYYLKPLTHLLMTAFNGLYLGATQPVTFAAEFRCGLSPEFSARDHVVQAVTAMTYGFHGWNWFMAVKRERWPTGPIEEDGRPTRVFKDLSRVVRAYSELEWPNFERVANVALIWDRRDAFLDKPAPMEPVFDINVDSPSNHAFKQLVLANVPLALHVARGDREAAFDEFDAVVYAGHGYSNRATAEALRARVEAGGVAIFTGAFPSYDFDLQPMDAFEGVAPPTRRVCHHGGGAVVHVGNGSDRTVLVETSYFADFDLSDLKISNVVEFYHRGHVVGFLGQLGQGKLVCCGFEVTAHCWRELLKLAGVKLPYEVSSSHLQVGVFIRRDGGGIAVPHVNVGDGQAKALLRFGDEFELPGSARALLSGRKVSASGSRVTLQLGPRDADILLLDGRICD